MRAEPGKVTIYSVAHRAAVSISTVSLVMNAPHRVRPETRERVVAAAAELGYRPGRAASGTGVGALRIVVAAPFSSYPSYFRRLAGMMAHAAEAAVELSPFDLPSAAASVSPLLDTLPARRGVDGVIVMGVPLADAALRASRQAQLPVVLVDVRRARPRGSDLPAVLVDDEAGGRMIGEHLAGRGHVRAVFLHEPQRSHDYISAGMLRARGLGESVELVEAVVEPGTDPERALLDAFEVAPSAAPSSPTTTSSPRVPGERWSEPAGGWLRRLRSSVTTTATSPPHSTSPRLPNRSRSPGGRRSSCCWPRSPAPTPAYPVSI